MLQFYPALFPKAGNAVVTRPYFFDFTIRRTEWQTI